MIITLKGANFSGEGNNIGTLDSYSIRFSGNVTNSNTSVDRESNTGYTTTITLTEGYELNGSITVTMGGTDITSTAVSGLTITIPTKVTGNVVITVPTKNTATGEEEEPETPVTPTTTWYVSGAAVDRGLNELKTDNGSYGLGWGPNEYAAMKNKTINVVRFVTTSTSGDIRIGVADKIEGTTITDAQIIHFTKATTDKELITVKFNTPITLTGDQVLVWEPSDIERLPRNYVMYYAYDKSLANQDGWYTRCPIDRRTPETPTPWSYSENATINVDVGYVEE